MTNPIIIKNLSQSKNCETIERIALDNPPYNEKWLQVFLHNHPTIIPASEIESRFETLVPVAREFSVSSGYIDNLFITPDGYPVLVEVKLWKNQDSRRRIILQLLEYAKDLSEVTYKQINEQIISSFKDKVYNDNPLYEIVSEYTDKAIEEGNFVRNVSRNLRDGNFLLLLLGDGIRDEMASLATHFEQHYRLRYVLGIVQIKLFSLSNGSIIAFPEVFAKTEIIERHIIVATQQTENLHVLSKNTTALNTAYDAPSKTKTIKPNLTIEDIWNSSELKDIFVFDESSQEIFALSCPPWELHNCEHFKPRKINAEDYTYFNLYLGRHGIKQTFSITNRLFKAFAKQKVVNLGEDEISVDIENAIAKYLHDKQVFEGFTTSEIMSICGVRVDQKSTVLTGRFKRAIKGLGWVEGRGEGELGDCARIWKESFRTKKLQDITRSKSQ